MIRLDRVLFSPIFYVADHGMNPQMLSQDGDPFLVYLVSEGSSVEAMPPSSPCILSGC